jgi:CRP-like cAMP-binding protein
MTRSPRPRNRILAALPDGEFARLYPKLREVSLPIGEIIYLPEQQIEDVYFINRGVISWLTALQDGNTVEAGLIGPEGVAGIAIILGASSTPNQALAQSPVEALKIRAADLVVEFRQGGELQDLLLRFVQAMFVQVAQTAACNRLHTLDQRLARWLLMTHDRLDDGKFPLTQEFLSHMLGVRRAGVSVAANNLRQIGLIDYHRGNITIVDLSGLARVACDCYPIVKAEYSAFLRA